MGIALTLWLDFNQVVMTFDEYEESWLQGVYTRVVLLLLALFFTATIGFSRVIMGVHSWNQLLYGWQLGLWLALTLHHVFKKIIMDSLQKLFKGEETNYKGLTIKIGSIFLIALILEIVNFIVENNHIENEPLWIENIQAKCSHEDLDHAFQMKSMIDNGAIGLGFGAFLGVIYHAQW